MFRSRRLRNFIFFAGLVPIAIWAAVFGTVRGVVHDPDHRPVEGAEVAVKSSTSDYAQKLTTDADGGFEASALPVGAYLVTVSKDGFARSVQEVVIASGSAPVLHFQLMIGTRSEQVTVAESALTVNPEQMTPATIVSRSEIAMTPGADLSNSLTAITDYVPGAWMTHDQLHVRGGHQVTWAIDGFQSRIPISPAISGLRSTQRISTTSKPNEAVIPRPMATVLTVCSTSCQERASSATTRANYSRLSAHFTRQMTK